MGMGGGVRIYFIGGAGKGRVGAVVRVCRYLPTLIALLRLIFLVALAAARGSLVSNGAGLGANSSRKLHHESNLVGRHSRGGQVAHDLASGPHR